MLFLWALSSWAVILGDCDIEILVNLQCNERYGSEYRVMVLFFMIPNCCQNTTGIITVSTLVYRFRLSKPCSRIKLLLTIFLWPWYIKAIKSKSKLSLLTFSKMVSDEAAGLGRNVDTHDYISCYSCFWWWSTVKSTESDYGFSNALTR